MPWQNGQRIELEIVLNLQKMLSKKDQDKVGQRSKLFQIKRSSNHKSQKTNAENSKQNSYKKYKVKKLNSRCHIKVNIRLLEDLQE